MNNLETTATCVNHIASPKQGGAMWEAANHESLCRACNTRHAIAHGLAFDSPVQDAPLTERGFRMRRKAKVSHTRAKHCGRAATQSMAGDVHKW
jgi:hypothetical protein